MGLGRKIGFIGSGNMATAIVRGMLQQALVTPGEIYISDVNPDQVARVAEATGVQPSRDNLALTAAADIIILATKPQHVPGVMAEIRPALDPGRHVIVSICAGVPTNKIEAAADTSGLPVVRVMPNTPALISCGSAAISGGLHVTHEHLNLVTQIFDSVGTSVVVDEAKLDAVTGVSGSGPAYVFRFIEVLLEGARRRGLTDHEARVLVPQMVLGAARMAVEDGRSLEDLRTAVTTPGGTTAAGLQVLEDGGFADLIARCIAAATERSRELGQ